MKTWPTAAIVILAFLTHPWPQDSSSIHDVLAARIRPLVDKGFAGQVIVAKNGQVLLSDAYGHAHHDHTARITRETVFDVASATKAFAAAAILSLRDGGRLQLQSTIGELLPETPPDKHAITVEQLLEHTSGLRQTYAADGEVDRSTAVRLVLSQPLGSVPGQEFSYSDDGYVILAAVIEVASGVSYEQYLRAHELAPAGMTHTSFWGEINFADSSRTAPFVKPLDTRLLRPQWGQRGSGGLLSTADDLFQWWVALSTGRVVSRSSVDELTREHRRLPSGIGVGYGWFWSTTDTGTRTLWSRGNEDFGPNAILTVYPQNQMLVAVTSDDFIDGVPWSRRVSSALEAVVLREK
jgi:CubicO group peptidase (beta-lactamase class C family)